MSQPTLQNGSEWQTRWSENYTAWCNQLDAIREDPAFGLKPNGTRLENALALTAFYESRDDPSMHAALTKLRRDGRAIMSQSHYGPEEYMRNQGLSEAFNVQLMIMGLDASNGKTNKAGTNIVLDSFGAILLLNYYLQDRDPTDMFEKFKVNRDPYPERVADAVLKDVQQFLDNLPLLTPELRECLPKLRALVEPVDLHKILNTQAEVKIDIEYSSAEE